MHVYGKYLRYIYMYTVLLCNKLKYFLVEKKSTVYETRAQCTNFKNQGTARNDMFQVDRNKHHGN